MIRFDATFIQFAREGDDYKVIIASPNNEGLPESDLKRLDTSRYMKNPVVLWQHKMFDGLPIGKTSRLEFRSDGSLVATFRFLEGDEQATRVRNAWDQGFIGAASVGWKYDEKDIPVLLEWSIVTVPRDSEALRACIDPNYNGDKSNKQTLEDLSMGDKENLKKEILDELKSSNQAKEDKINLASFGEKILTGVDKLIDSRFKAFEDKRNTEAEELKKKLEDQNKQTASEEKIREEAEHRATLLASVKGILPDTFDSKKASVRDIINAALGEEADKYKGKSDGYVEAILDGVIENRSTAGLPSIQTGTLPKTHMAGFHKPLNTVELRNLARQSIN